MRKITVIMTMILLATASVATAQGRNAGDRALGSELSRDKAETRIERLRQDQRQKDERPVPRAQKLPADGSTRQQAPR
jgi:hypothetical protein